MKFLVDRCAGRRLVEWLRTEGHDVLDVRTLGSDPGDRRLLQVASETGRIVVVGAAAPLFRSARPPAAGPHP